MLKIIKAADGEAGSPIPEDDFKALSNRQDRFFIVGMLMRPGVSAFATRLEFEYFPPLTPANDDFDLYLLEWCEIPWGVISIPVASRQRAEELAKVSGLCFADGVPVILGMPEGVQSFPLTGPNVFTLENLAGSPVYDGPARVKEMLHAERDDVKRHIRETIIKSN